MCKLAKYINPGISLLRATNNLKDGNQMLAKYKIVQLFVLRDSFTGHGNYFTGHGNQ
jgi:hypothetical protein